VLTPTHLVTGQTAFLVGSIVTGHAPNLGEAGLAMAASLLPDLDSRQSYLGRLLPMVSEPLEHHFGHRTLTHSLLLQAGVGALAYAALPFGYALALISGRLSHSLADMMTPAGVCWLWPSRVRCVLPGNRKYRMQSMGRGELVFLLLMALLGWLAKPLAGSGLGTLGLIRSAIGNIHSAREDYDARKGQHAWSLQVSGRDNRSYDDIAGTYPVIGPYREAGFILATPKGPRSLCRSASCDWYAEEAALRKGAAETTTTTTVITERLQADALLSALAPLQSVGAVYLLGSLSARGKSPSPPTIEVTGETVSLRYAAPDVLAEWGNNVLRDVDLSVQVRHAPGVSVPEPALPMGEGADGIPKRLRRWIERLDPSSDTAPFLPHSHGAK